MPSVGLYHVRNKTQGLRSAQHSGLIWRQCSGLIWRKILIAHNFGAFRVWKF